MPMSVDPQPVPVAALNELLDTYRDLALHPACNRMWLALAQLVGEYEDEARLQVEGVGVLGRFQCSQCQLYKTADDFVEEDYGNGPILSDVCRDCHA
jgi:hypothetical protein